LAAQGAIATASSTVNGAFPASAAIDGDRKGANWGAGGGWNDGTANAWPDWLEVDFAGQKTIDEIDVFTVQDNYGAPIEPTPSLTFSLYGLTDFTVQYWNGTQWAAVPSGVVSGNTLVWRQVTFAALTTTKVRVLITGALGSFSRVTEVEAYQSTGGLPANTPPTVTLTGPAEGATYTLPATVNFAATAADSDGTVKRVDFYANGALVGTDAVSPYQFAWTPGTSGNYTLTAVAVDNLDVSTTSAPVHVTVNGPAGRTNVALAAQGAIATASSTVNGAFPASAAIDGDRKGANWGAGGGWNDATANAWPDWLEVDFAGLKTIDEIDVFTVQDNYGAPIEPTMSLTFTNYGIRDFTVQYWDGLVWQNAAGGQIVGNTNVWRTITFPAVSTDRIRVMISNGLAGYSRVVEVEAYQVSQ
jgi:hypothetical protein